MSQTAKTLETTKTFMDVNTTALHEPYCTLVREPITQGEVIEGLAQLVTSGAVEITDLVEALHREILLRPFGLHDEEHIERWETGIAGRIYQIIRQLMSSNGKLIALSLRRLNQQIGYKQRHRALPDNLKVVVNIINGTLGDHLINQHNPLAVSMILYDAFGHPQQQPLSGRVIIFIHGLCLSYLSWHPDDINGYGRQIQRHFPESTILYLDYNSGRRISKNGRSFARLLDELVRNHPDITHIDLVGHSMGGLVTRSALYYGNKEQKDWLKKIDHLICLGSPHHGAMLENMSFFIQDVVSKLPFAGAFSHLLDLRSAGIIDLRHGSVRDDDWEYLPDRMGVIEDRRRPAPVPQNIKAFLLAGSLENSPSKRFTPNLFGDGLVTIDSALGEYIGELHLNVPESHKAVYYGVGHMALQNDARVCCQLIKWLATTDKTASTLRVISIAPDQSLTQQLLEKHLFVKTQDQTNVCGSAPQNTTVNHSEHQVTFNSDLTDSALCASQPVTSATKLCECIPVSQLKKDDSSNENT